MGLRRTLDSPEARNSLRAWSPHPAQPISEMMCVEKTTNRSNVRPASNA